MRGKDHTFLPLCRIVGITPAYAGKSFSGCFQIISVQDHPRLCGEKQHSCQPAEFDTGSPPPMRGKGKLQMTINLGIRITPAYAGKSRRRSLRCRPLRDHPRLCGEKCGQYDFDTMDWGSPPPMRGKGTKITV